MFGTHRPKNVKALAAVLAVIAITTGVVYWWNMPRTLSIVIPNLAGPELRLFGTFGDILRRDGAGIRINVVGVDHSAAAQEAVKAGKADLALVRIDGMPQGAQLHQVALIRREPIVLVAPRGRGIDALTDIAEKSIGVVRGVAPNLAIVREILAERGVEDVTLVPLNYGDIASALKDKRVAAVISIGSPSQRVVQDILADVAREGRGEPVLIAMELTEAVGGRSARVEMSEVPRGAFGGSTPRPAEALNTVAVSVRLMARPELDETLASELLERLLAARQRLVSQENPIASLIEPPDTDADNVLTVHRGALAHLNGEKRGFLDRYSDLFYFLLFAGSLVGSGFAGLMSLGKRDKKHQAPEKLKRLVALLPAARSANTTAALDAIEDELADIVAFTLDCAADKVLDTGEVEAIKIGVAEVRIAIERGRRRIDSVPAPVLVPAAAE